VQRSPPLECQTAFDSLQILMSPSAAAALTWALERPAGRPGPNSAHPNVALRPCRWPAHGQGARSCFPASSMALAASAAGLRWRPLLNTSPHLVSFGVSSGSRLGQARSQRPSAASCFQGLQRLAQRMPHSVRADHPAAFSWPSPSAAGDLCVLEVGLGGRLDAPACSPIRQWWASAIGIDQAE